ncbi:MAG: 3-hydroxyacyl-CoA dehydrogenase family protein, partial [Clostridia bacterium]|nr:3-hydroxyacyl-CoA dehydrogenase family protein [Clostridia bacterium]
MTARLPRLVGSVGAGTMGSGIAETVLRHGFSVLLWSRSRATLERARASIADRLASAERRGRLTEPAEQVLARLTITEDLDAMSRADFVIESALEDLAVKCDLFRRLDALCPPPVVLATNTSTLPLAAVAGVTTRPERVVAMHWYHPPQAMRLVEVVRSLATDDATVTATMALARALGKEPILVRKDSPGYIVNRIHVMILVEALRIVEEGVATPEEVDRAVQLALNHPQGPFTIADQVGLDIEAAALSHLHRERGEERYAPPRLLKELVRLGRLGRKAGRGFYD